MKTIYLTQGKLAKVDDEDYSTINSFRWQAVKGRYTYYARGGDWYMHQMVLNKPYDRIDHINGDGLDNQKSNLRLANKSENARNCKLQKNNTSGFRGVSFQKQLRKWMAYIKLNNKRVYIGVFFTKEEAAYARDEMAIKHHGEFAVLNFPKT